MAHDIRNLEVHQFSATNGSGPGAIFTEGKLITADAPSVVEAANYLNLSASRLPKGTALRAVMTTGGTPVLKDYIVTANTGTAVTIAVATAAAG